MFCPRQLTSRHYVSLNLIRRMLSWDCQSLRYSENGDPEKVVQLVQEKVNCELRAKDVAVKILASTINPANINTIQGVYAVKPPLPAIGGSEAVAEVIDVGSHVKELKVGDRVIPGGSESGTWRNYGVYPEDDLVKIPNDIPIVDAATITVNPCTAFRMLHDFSGLWKGDAIIQNGANSAVGQAVIQIAADREWQTINIIRDRPDKADVVKFLVELGATHVITDADLKRPEVLKSLPPARLGLNCVGGKAVSDMIKFMQEGSTLVTYGGMSKQPMIVPTAAMIFKDILLVGFWMTRWVKEHSADERGEMLDSLFELVRAGKLRPPEVEPVLLTDYKRALQSAQEGFTGKKYLFVMDDGVMGKVTKEIQEIGSRKKKSKSTV